MIKENKPHRSFLSFSIFTIINLIWKIMDRDEDLIFFLFIPNILTEDDKVKMNKSKHNQKGKKWILFCENWEVSKKKKKSSEEWDFQKSQSNISNL